MSGALVSDCFWEVICEYVTTVVRNNMQTDIPLDGWL